MLALQSVTTPDVSLADATLNIHAGEHWELYGDFIYESYGKLQSRSCPCLSAFLLLRDGCSMSTLTCGKAYQMIPLMRQSVVHFLFFLEFKAAFYQIWKKETCVVCMLMFIVRRTTVTQLESQTLFLLERKDWPKYWYAVVHYSVDTRAIYTINQCLLIMLYIENR